MICFNYLKNFLFMFLVFIPMSGFAVDNCLRFKYDVDVNIKDDENVEIKIGKSDENLKGKLGYTESRISYNYQLLLIPVRVENGYCVSLRSIDIELLPKFNVILDKRLKEKTCAHKVVFDHEQDHVNVYKNTLKDNIDKIKKSVVEATKKVNPVFIENIEDVEKIQKDFAEKIENYKTVLQIKEKIKTKTDEENNKIDTRGDDYTLWKCKDFFEEMKEFYYTISID